MSNLPIPKILNQYHSSAPPPSAAVSYASQMRQAAAGQVRAAFNGLIHERILAMERISPPGWNLQQLFPPFPFLLDNCVSFFPPSFIKVF